MTADGAGTPAIGVRARPAAVGAFWLRGGVILFRRRPLQMLALSGSVLLLTVYLAFYGPSVLRSLSLLAYPALLQVMLSTSRAADEGDAAGMAKLAQLFRDPRIRLRMLQLGVVFALAFGVLVQFMQWLPVPGSAPVGIDAGGENAHPPAAGPVAPGADVPGASGDTATALRLLAFVATMIPVLFVVQFATALVSWHGMPSLKALFFAFFASWRNLSPILIYLLALFGLVALLMIFLMSMALIFQFTQSTLYLLLPLLPLLILPVLAASGYVMVRDVIVEEEAKV
jgi:hypothetical protein